jgi:hypothetical protein
MVTMAGAGHFGWAEQAPAFNQHLTGFIKALGWLG